MNYTISYSARSKYEYMVFIRLSLTCLFTVRYQDKWYSRRVPIGYYTFSILKQHLKTFVTSVDSDLAVHSPSLIWLCNVSQLFIESFKKHLLISIYLEHYHRCTDRS